jgi:N-acetylmuramoyl-L-alanine amidase
MTLAQSLPRLVLAAFLLLQPGILSRGQAQSDLPVVVLDPGHGWATDSGDIDPGAISGDLVEKDLTLEVARHVRTYLSRCPVDVFLTREGDDSSHTPSDLDDLVNAQHPALGVSIHVNSADGAPTGAEAWYTVGGYDDANSQLLASLLSAGIAERLSIPNRGIKPETANRLGGLYIHYWQAPSALIEIGFLQGDAGLLYDRRPDFGRAIAQSILMYLGLPVTCADAAVPDGAAMTTYFPGDTGTVELSLRNDGLMTWQPEAYTLASVRNPYGAAPSYPLAQATPVGEDATWEIPATAPETPGVYRQVWQLHRGTDAVGSEAIVYLVVLPEGARDLRDEVDRKIDEMRARGEQEIEELVRELEQQAVEWVRQEVARQVERQVSQRCPGSSTLVVGLLLGSAARLSYRGRRPRK